MTQKAAIYDPYLDTLGGGERYCLTIAETLLKQGYAVDIFWSGDKDILSKAQARFDLDISNLNIVPDIFQIIPSTIEASEDSESLSKIIRLKSTKYSLINKFKNIVNKFYITKNYDLIFYLSDWSLPFIFSKNNIIHVQVPFARKLLPKTKLLNAFKMFFIKNIVCNSNFTRNFAVKQFGKKCAVIYPPVDILKLLPDTTKENIILSVGRFDNILNSKKQDVLIDTFKKLKVSNWKLVFAGGSLIAPENNSYLHHLQTIAKPYPIEFFVNPKFEELKSIYEKSKIYWHAAGFSVDQEIHPENTEHFGMAPVEAMAAGLVPLLVNKGGLSEVIENNINGYLWNSTDELLTKTQLLINSPAVLNQMSTAAIARSHEFSKSTFIDNFNKII